MGSARYLTCSGAVPLETTPPHPNNSMSSIIQHLHDPKLIQLPLFQAIKTTMN